MYITGGTLTGDVTDKDSSIRRFLQSKFPNLKPFQADYKARSGGLIVEGSTASASDIGTAMDLMIRSLIEPDDVPASALAMFPFNPDYQAGVITLAATVSRAVGESQAGQVEFARAVWGLALCVAAHRAGAAFAPFVPDLVHNGLFDAETMMGQASDEAVAELVSLRGLAERSLLPELKAPFHLGPQFDLSVVGPAQRIAAEADLISDGLLLDVKTQLGLKNKAGIRYDVLRPEQLYQLLAYALLDYSDRYAINKLGIYSARYGTLVSWPLDYVMATAAGMTIDLRQARQELWDILQGEIHFKER